MIRSICLSLYLIYPGLLIAQVPTQPDLQKEILEMVRKDQAFQEIIIQKSMSGQPVLPADWARKDSVFVSHIQRGKEILAEYGWPTFELVGEEGSNGMFLIVQHADADTAFQKDALKLLREAYENGQAASQNVAYLEDRVRLADGLPQLYGTQLDYDDRACPVAGEIEEISKVDARREEFGLEPLAAYLTQAIELQGKAALCTDK